MDNRKNCPDLQALLDYAEEKGLIEQDDRTYCFNRLLQILGMDAPLEEAENPAACREEGQTTSPDEQNRLAAILDGIDDWAVEKGIIEDGVVTRDLFDSRVMDIVTPWPHEVRRKFRALFSENPEAATDWFYRFSNDTNYIRRDRIARDRKWVYSGPYGALDITINLSKPEKDPRAIAAAKLLPQTDYPKCQLCAENEGYAGRLNHPGRSNHRPVPVQIAGESWFFQYSPYVYYNEHCIVFNSRHVPMKIDEAAFRKLFSFITQFPHYFVGSNADLPIVGGSILSHDHFQGGRYTFAMERAEVEEKVSFRAYPDIAAGIVSWPMSVLRLRGKDPERVIALAVHLLGCWRGYTDEAAFIFAETEGTPHNTITPIARRRGEDYELDLVLRNNITTEEFPLGVYHPHQELHHIKKENIGLIEVMGLAVLPARLLEELDALKTAMLRGEDLRQNALTAAHADWAEEILRRRDFTEENAESVLQEEVGAVFERVLEDAGVFKRDEAGRAAFRRFLKTADR
ncbi:MAG: UDP-glucose--hexose-1-phosphate uridylyltransferase [Oscillospiraceae bacterium]|nr:UDP-glucose--hexose-1-phosphate uridylyltransferase [Oscillospiraceae bacterium]